ncbi:MAG TPA: hypothetical protein PLO24_09505 [Bacteroidales bacterium]|jgi:hypothetical protein|nr:hypothetical protein [Bacteroidales bacterium]HQH25368.1 hypothetical protein [Bacteroidales bacterium]HQJ82964.1 hypothetical protein [Bacteroidales bacterium]
MKKPSLFIFLVLIVPASVIYSQYSAYNADHSFRYYATPGFVNITEFHGAAGLIDYEGPGESSQDRESLNSDYYFGVSNVFGYQIDRNFFAGIGVGFFHYELDNLFPFYLEYKYSMYMKRFTLYFYGDGGTLFKPDPDRFSDESKIFINPGFGISRTITPKTEINLSAGYMVQARTTISRVTFLNIKLGVSFRRNAFRMFRN